MSHDLWVILIGSLVAGSCGLIGSLMVLRKLSMVGDAISHAVLPGIVIAFLFSNSMSTPVMVLGAAVFGLLATIFIQGMEHLGIQTEAAIGISFTALFAMGVVLLSLFADSVHLDLQHVLYGEIAYEPYYLITLGGITLPKAVWVMGSVFLITLFLIFLFYKELKITSFDPLLASSLGIPVLFFHYLAMGLVSLNTVAAFESVGAILVVAMLIVPGAIAYLWTNRFHRMLVLSVFFGVLSAVSGYWLAALFDVSIAGMMSVSAALLFIFSFCFSPNQGIFIRYLLRKRLRESAN